MYIYKRVLHRRRCCVVAGGGRALVSALASLAGALRILAMRWLSRMLLSVNITGT